MREIAYQGRDGWPLCAAAVGSGPVTLRVEGCT